MMALENGYYWYRCGDLGEWAPARYHDGTWSTLGSQSVVSGVVEVGPRILLDDADMRRAYEEAMIDVNELICEYVEDVDGNPYFGPFTDFTYAGDNGVVVSWQNLFYALEYYRVQTGRLMRK